MGTANELEQRLRKTRRARIGTCEVDFGLNEVCEGERCTRLMPKAAATLEVLVFSAGQPVSKERLLAEIWRDEFPTEDVITNAICQLRKAFGDDARAPRYIRTVPRVGYVLVAPLAALPAAPMMSWTIDAAPSAEPGEFERELHRAVRQDRMDPRDAEGASPAPAARANLRTAMPLRVRMPTWLLLSCVIAMLVIASVLMVGSAWWNSHSPLERPLSAPSKDSRGGHAGAATVDQVTRPVSGSSPSLPGEYPLGHANSVRWKQLLVSL